MNSRALIGLLFAVIAAFVVFETSTYTVSEMEQAITTEFGQPVGAPIREAGLYFKPPWYAVTYFDKRIMRWDGDPTRIPTKDKKWLLVDTTARWRIVDPLTFLQSVRNERGAQARLDSVVDSAVRESVTLWPLIELVRSGNGILEVIKKERTQAQKEFDVLGQAAATTTPQIFEEAAESDNDAGDEILQVIKHGRDKIEADILQRSRKLVRDSYGIELVDVVVRRVNYSDDVSKNVYDRMISERHKVAERYRSAGAGRRAVIRGEMERKLNRIESEAYKQAREIEGSGDAEAARIYAEAYNRDPEFYAFTRSLELYPKTIGGKARLVLTTDSDFLKYLKHIDAK